MIYKHPKKYKGLKIDTPNNQNIMRAYVEQNCLKCDLFCGREHDFSECKTYFSEESTCPTIARPVSVIAPEQFIKCGVEQ